MQSITQIIKAISTKLIRTNNEISIKSAGTSENKQDGVIDEEEFLMNFLDEEESESWIRIRQIVKYLEKEEDTETLGEDSVWVRIKQSASQRFAQSAEEKKEIKEKASLPDEYSEFQSVFNKKESERLPEHRPWDCKIEEKPDFQ